MKRRDAIARVVAAAAALAAGVGRAQARMPLLVVLMHGKESAFPGRIAALIEGLRELGYVEGRDYRLEVRWSDNRVERRLRTFIPKVAL